MKLGLDNIRALLADLGSPHRKYHVVQVAGTNGKGSTSVFLAAALRAAGRRVGLFTSPHLVDFRERVRVDGQPIPEEDVVRAWVQVRPGVERRNMTFFEANTAIALSHFAARGCDVAVLETGMGGRLDSTTAAGASVCVLTRIAFDHRDYLGKTLAAIAGEKAAILHAGARGFSAPQSPEPARAIRESAARTGAELVFVEEPGDVRITEAGTTFTWRGERVRMRMVGRHQAQNAVLALETLADLLPSTPPQALAAPLAGVEVPGRFQCVARPAGRLLLDVAHNPDALGCFAQALADAYPRPPKRILVAMLRDKDLAGSLAALAAAPGVELPLLVGSSATAPEARRLREEDWLALPERARRVSAWVGGVPEGLARLEAWQTRTPGGITGVVGSFTSVGEAMQLVGVDPLPG